MKTPNFVPAGTSRATPVARRHPGVECLESRIAPAAIATPASFSYTDADGDLVEVHITGKSGTAEFLDAGGLDVAVTGGDIAKIILTKPSKDFAIVFADQNTAVGPAVGDNVIELGMISGVGGARLPVIKGIFTTNSSPGAEYHLGGFIGTSFTTGGGLGIVGFLTGDGVTATTDVDLKALNKGTSVVFTGGVDFGATASIEGKVAGTVTTGNVSGDLSLGIVSGFVQVGHVSGSLTVVKDLSGRIVLGDPDPLALPQTDEVTIVGKVLPAGVINAAQDLVLHVAKDLAGSVLVGGSLIVDVTGALKGASLVVGADLALDITGVVSGSAMVAQLTVKSGSIFRNGMKNSSIVGGSGLNLDVIGSVAKSRFSGGTVDLNVSISGKVAGSQFLAGGNAFVTTGFSVTGSSILPDGRLDLTVGTPAQGPIRGVGDVSTSVIGSKSTSAVVNIGGKVVGSNFTVGTDLDVTIGTSLERTVVQTGNNLLLDVGTNVKGSRIAVGSDADVVIGGQLASSALIISNNLIAEISHPGQPVVGKLQSIASGITSSRIETSDGSSVLAIVGPVARTVIESGENITLAAEDLTGFDPITNQLRVLKAGKMNKDVYLVAAVDVIATSTTLGKVGARIISGHDVTLEVAGEFNGAINAAHDLDFRAGSVLMSKSGGKATGSAGTIPAPVLGPGGAGSVNILAKPGLRVGGDLKFVVTGNVVAPLIDVIGNVNDFRVGGSLNGGIYVGGNFVAGTTTAAATVVGGAVAKSTLLHIGGDVGNATSAPTLVFGGGFAGQLEIGRDLLTDLTFNGAVNRIAIIGRVGATVAPTGDGVADIIVKGKLTSFSSASTFARTSANGGNFVDAVGTITGVLQADGGASSVGPFEI